VRAVLLYKSLFLGRIEARGAAVDSEGYMCALQSSKVGKFRCFDCLRRCMQAVPANNGVKHIPCWWFVSSVDLYALGVFWLLPRSVMFFLCNSQ